MTLKIGDTVRLKARYRGFRSSAIYTAIDVEPGSLAFVTEEIPGGVGATVLRFIKSRQEWILTKVRITLWTDSLRAHHKDGWEQLGPLDLLAASVERA